MKPVLSSALTAAASPGWTLGRLAFSLKLLPPPAAGLRVEPIVCLYAAPWINMSGPPTLLITWLKGNAIHGVPSPQGTVHEADIVAYLQATAYFSAHPRNFKHFQECVAAGARYLPID